MKILGIESSGKAAGVALWENGVVAEYTLHHSLTHSQTLMPLAERALADCGWELAQVDCYAVNVGPGSFTGVRIGVCAVNAMALSAQKEVAAVDALRVLYQGVSVYPGPVCALLDARNGNGYAALFENGVCVLPPRPVEVEAFCRQIPAGALMVGDGEAYADLLRRQVPGVVFAPAELNFCRPAALCAAAAQGFGVRQAQAAPMYLRPSQAERLFEERRQRNG